MNHIIAIEDNVKKEKKKKKKQRVKDDWQIYRVKVS